MVRPDYEREAHRPQPAKPWVIEQARREGARNFYAWKREVTAHEKAGEKLHPADPTDPWSETIWSPCDLTCIHIRSAS